MCGLTFKVACLVAVLAFGLAAPGCGSKHPGLVKVGGTVTLDGEPVTSGRVRFYPEEGRPSSGSIGSDGRFQLKTYEKNDGAKPGSYTVTVESYAAAPKNEPVYKSFEDELNGVMVKPEPTSKQKAAKKRVPRRYSNRGTSKLQVEVTKEGSDIDLALSTKG